MPVSAMEMSVGDEIMQIKLKIALVAAGFALASLPALAVDMPPDGTKNFSAPGDAPSYFTNETVPEPARVNHPETFDSQDEGIAPAAAEVGAAAPVRTEIGGFRRHAFAHRSAKHAAGGAKGHGGSTHVARTTSSSASRTAALRSNPRHANAATRSTSSAGSTGRTNTTKHARAGTRQHAALSVPPAMVRSSPA